MTTYNFVSRQCPRLKRPNIKWNPLCYPIGCYHDVPCVGPLIIWSSFKSQREYDIPAYDTRASPATNADNPIPTSMKHWRHLPLINLPHFDLASSATPVSYIPQFVRTLSLLLIPPFPLNLIVYTLLMVRLLFSLPNLFLLVNHQYLTNVA